MIALATAAVSDCPPRPLESPRGAHMAGVRYARLRLHRRAAGAHQLQRMQDAPRIPSRRAERAMRTMRPDQRGELILPCLLCLLCLHS